MVMWQLFIDKHTTQDYLQQQHRPTRDERISALGRRQSRRKCLGFSDSSNIFSVSKRLFLCGLVVGAATCFPSTFPFSSSSFSSNISMREKEFKTLLLDMDGVLAEVSQSYRAAIIKTCHAYGALSVTLDTVTEWKIRGNANDDWKLSHDLIKDDPDGRNDVSLQEVTDTFERFYQGDGELAGLCTLETLIPSRDTLLELRKRSKPGIGIVTGRPRVDCMKFIKDHELQDLIDATYCMEDGPSKPDPFPVLKVCELLGVEPSPSVVLVGDTPDDMKATLAAGCSGVGVITPEALEVQTAAGKSLETAPLCIAMKEAGADTLFEPGFAALVDRFPKPQ
jgi:HAD superfamily hydrolase (TIGR01548 family)